MCIHFVHFCTELVKTRRHQINHFEHFLGMTAVTVQNNVDATVPFYSLCCLETSKKICTMLLFLATEMKFLGIRVESSGCLFRQFFIVPPTVILNDTCIYPGLYLLQLHIGSPCHSVQKFLVILVWYTRHQRGPPIIWVFILSLIIFRSFFTYTRVWLVLFFPAEVKKNLYVDAQMQQWRECQYFILLLSANICPIQILHYILERCIFLGSTYFFRLGNKSFCKIHTPLVNAHKWRNHLHSNLVLVV